MKRLLLAFAALALLAPTPVAAAPTANLHEIKWFVHTDLVTGPMDIPFYEALLDAALEDAQVLALEGDQGPADTVCCNKLLKEEHSPGVTLTTFGTTGDGFDVMDALHPFPAYTAFGGSGSRGFIIDSITNCSGSSAIGCASTPLCDSTPDDDPDLVLVITMDASDSGVLGLTLAHERGHNACLNHVATNNCELMRAAVNGGCLSSSECDEIDDARQTTGGTCACHADVPLGDPSDDGTPCVDGAIVGQCSGGVCGETPGDASVQLVAAGGPGGSTGVTTDDPLLQHAVPGGWDDIGSFDGRTIRGLAYDPDAEVLYGIEDVAAADDRVVIIDPATGATSGAMTVTGHPDLIGLAFDPGATTGTGDDRLLATSEDVSFSGFEDLIVIDPSTGGATTIGTIGTGVGGGFSGLAYDDANDVLYASAFAGGSLWIIQDTGCAPGIPVVCSATEVVAVDLPRIDPSLAFSRDSGNLYLVGGQSSGRTLYNSIDPSTFAVTNTVGIDAYTAGGLSAVPLPEPGAAVSLAAGAALVGWLHRRRRA